MMTDKEITDVAMKTLLAAKTEETFSDVIETACRKVLALAAEKAAPVEPPAPARKPWPKGPVRVIGGEVIDVGQDLRLLTPYPTESGYRSAEAAALALTEFPAAVELLREYARLCGLWNSAKELFARVDASRFKL